MKVFFVISILLLTACSTVPKRQPPVGLQCFVKRGIILMKDGEVKLYSSDQPIPVNMKEYDACLLLKLQKKSAQ